MGNPGYTLEQSGLLVKLSTMASFQPTGRLYDGNGVEPDVVAAPTLDDVVGETDSVLDQARALIKNK